MTEKIKHGKQLSPGLIYELVAEAGFQKYFHFGGVDATKTLLAECPLDRNTYILDVGCATGKTACHIARSYGSRVVGVDIQPGMISRARERVIRENLEGRVHFQQGDAHSLPLEDDLFDLVIGEFITGLLVDKPAALNEYMRVVKPGGTIGLNEATWIKTPPPSELVEYLQRIFGVQGEIPDAAGWWEMLQDAGLRDVKWETFQAVSLSNKKDDMIDVLRVLPRVLYLVLKNPDFRSFLKISISVPKNLLDYFGYGIYTGIKPVGYNRSHMERVKR